MPAVKTPGAGGFECGGKTIPDPLVESKIGASDIPPKSPGLRELSDGKLHREFVSFYSFACLIGKAASPEHTPALEQRPEDPKILPAEI